MATNRDIVSRALANWSAGTGAISDILAPDVRWEIVGNSAVSRTYHGVDDFVTQALRPFDARFRPESPYRPVRVRALYEDPDANTVIAVFDGTGVTVAGTTHDSTVAWFLTFRDGKVADGTAFFDSIAFNEVWKIPPAC
ncbi:nuclear transport factor 2 family protein [Micromonospora sp. NPDC048063]|uniref:nuclear transport factor 2 family protein n=1 Tax=Micromonospora sp. NPDC048063 TaxID=3364256 RepID=UPI0037124169